MNEYRCIVDELLDEVVTAELEANREEIAHVVAEVAGRHEGRYCSIIECESYDKGELRDFYKELEGEIVDAMKIHDLL